MSDAKDPKSPSKQTRNAHSAKVVVEREKYAPNRIEEELEELHKKYRLSVTGLLCCTCAMRCQALTSDMAPPEENDRTGIQKARSERNEKETAEG
eukprot:175634-Rhodomonas_salina.1